MYWVPIHTERKRNNRKSVEGVPPSMSKGSGTCWFAARREYGTKQAHKAIGDRTKRLNLISINFRCAGTLRVALVYPQYVHMHVFTVQYVCIWYYCSTLYTMVHVWLNNNRSGIWWNCFVENNDSLGSEHEFIWKDLSIILRQFDN